MQFYGFLLFCSIVAVSQQYRSRPSRGECTTASRSAGTCMQWSQCKKLNVLLASARADSTQRQFVHNLIRASQCGGQGESFKLCCPKDDTIWHPMPSRKPKRLLPSRDECGQHSLLTKRIVGKGQITKITEFPWLVQLWYTNVYTGELTSECAGSLINQDHVLTAAHCVDLRMLAAKSIKLTFVRLGEYNSSSPVDCDTEGLCSPPPVDTPVAETYVHEEFNPNSMALGADIALIRLKRKSLYSDFIRPICLPITDNLANKNFDYEEFFVSGWGETENAYKSDVKLKVAVVGISDKYCATILRKQLLGLSHRQLCAGGINGVGTCRGDSGGPLLGWDNRDKVWYLAGIVSFGAGKCGSAGIPDVFSRVDQFIDWIVDRLR